MDELRLAPSDVLDAPLRELRQLCRLQPPPPSPELNQLLLTGLPRARFERTRRRTILVSSALAVTVATGVTGMAAAHDSPRSGSPVETTTTTRFDPGGSQQRASIAPRPSPVVPAGAPSTPVEYEDDPTPSGRAKAATSSSPPVARPSALTLSGEPRHESEAPDDRSRFTSPSPSISFTHQDD